jgi:hypothetical protein
MESRKQGILTISWKKLTIKAPSRNPITTTTYKTLEEIVESYFYNRTQDKRRKN